MDLLNIAVWFTATLIFILGPIILIHELGHFLAAKRAGVRVEEFGLGFPPRLLTLAGEEGTLKIGGVQLTIPGRLRLPLGLAKGQQVEALARQEADGTYRLLRLTPAGRDGPESPPPPREETAEGTLLRGALTTFDPGTQYTLNWIPLGAFVRMTGEENPSDPRSLAAQPKRWRLAVLLAGPVANVLAALLLLTAGYVTGHPELFHVRVGGVEAGSAAEAAGFQIDDVILSIGDTLIEGTMPLEAQEQLKSIIEDSAGQPLAFSIERGGEPLTLTATPQSVEGRGFLGIVMLGVETSQGIVHYSPPRAAFAATQDTIGTLVLLIQLPRMLAQGEVQPADIQPTSVVGINEILTLSLQESIQLGRPWYALHTASMVSLALGLTNLLPLPALDGGRILFVVIEAIRRRRIRPEVEAAIHFAGMVILLALIALVMIQDIVNPVIPWSLLNQ